jgi:hypothetical protein
MRDLIGDLMTALAERRRLSPAAVAQHAGSTGFRRLLDRDVLQGEPFPRAWKSCDPCDCEATERRLEVRGDRVFAVCDHRPDADIALEGLPTYQVDAAAIAKCLREDNRFLHRFEEVRAGLWIYEPLVEIDSVVNVRLAFADQFAIADVEALDAAFNEKDDCSFRVLLLAEEFCFLELRRAAGAAKICLRPLNAVLTYRWDHNPFEINVQRLPGPLYAPRPTGPLLLDEAIYGFGDPDVAAEAILLKRRGYSGPLIMSLNGPPSTYETNVFRFRELEQQLQQQLLTQLQTGTLQAHGLTKDSVFDEQPLRLIPSAVWSRVKPDFKKGELLAAGQTITNIEVSLPEPIETPANTAEGSVRTMLDVRLRLFRSSKTITVDGETKSAASIAFAVIWTLAEALAADRPTVLTRHIDDAVADYMKNESNVPTADRIRRARELLRGFKTADGRNPVEILNQRDPNGYRLSLAQAEVELLP